MSAILEVKDLKVSFATRGGEVPAVDGVSFGIQRGEIVGLVGESGCGKTTVAHSILRLLPNHAATTGEITFAGSNVLAMSEREMRELRGKRISVIVQDALAALNPVRRVREQLTDELRDHDRVRGSRARTRAINMLSRVGLTRPEMRARRYPHELSGGMQQRVLIAAALLLGPELIIADEPTTALDVTVQAQILSLLRGLRDETGAAILFVTHDLSTVAQLCDRLLVMYAGMLVEEGPVREIFKSPRHPYTRGLIASIPPLDGDPPEMLPTIPGTLPTSADWPAGCLFASRCQLRQSMGDPEVCLTERPGRKGSSSHWGACHFAEQLVEAEPA